MGGIMFIIRQLRRGGHLHRIFVAERRAKRSSCSIRVIAGALMAVGFGIVGFLDDYISIKSSIATSVSPRFKELICSSSSLAPTCFPSHLRAAPPNSYPVPWLR